MTLGTVSTDISSKVIQKLTISTPVGQDFGCLDHILGIGRPETVKNGTHALQRLEISPAAACIGVSLLQGCMKFLEVKTASCFGRPLGMFNDALQ